MSLRHLALACSVIVAAAAAAPAQELRGPNELPPEGFGGTAYVDSGGCAFVRAGVGGRVTWVPRVSRTRAQVCGMAPSFVPDTAKAASGGPAAALPPVRRARVQAGKPVGVAACPPKAPQVAHVVLRDRRALAVCVASGTPLSATPVAGRAAALPLAIDMGGGAGRIGCPSSAPVATRFALKGGGATVLCVPEGGTPALASVPKGYLLAWSGAGDPARFSAAGPVPASLSADSMTDARRFVQVGSFAEAANAERARAKVAALGLPVAEARATIGGQAVRVVFAGPFDGAGAAQAALRAARDAGFGDAFLR